MKCASCDNPVGGAYYPPYREYGPENVVLCLNCDKGRRAVTAPVDTVVLWVNEDDGTPHVETVFAFVESDLGYWRPLLQSETGAQGATHEFTLEAGKLMRRADVPQGADWAAWRTAHLSMLAEREKRHAKIEAEVAAAKAAKAAKAEKEAAERAARRVLGEPFV